ncbi:MAG: sulfatase [Pirellulaceae bacterium]
MKTRSPMLLQHRFSNWMTAMALMAIWVTLRADSFGAEKRVERRPPNIVFVLADDLGWTDINCFDPKSRGFYETPHVDNLARQGMRFTSAYANGANCAPTRAALISGQYYPRQPIYHVGSPSQGMLIPAENGRFLPLEKITLAEALKQGGYATGFIGKWHIGDPPRRGPRQQGFDLNVGGYNAGNPRGWKGGYYEPNNNPYIDDARQREYLTDYLTRKAVGFVQDHRDEPFYLQLSYYTPHSPFQAPKSRVQKYREKKGQGGHEDPTYAAMIDSLDRGVGQLMQTLDQLDLAENTIFIFLSDNGGRGGYGFLGHAGNNITSNAPLKSGKGSFYEGGIRVPLIVRWPRRIEPATTCDLPVITIDFYPTLLDAAGLTKPSGYVLDGVNLMPVLNDPKATLNREALYWHFPGYPNAKWRTSPVSLIRAGRWKLMKYYEDNHLELYDLEQDLGETNDLAEECPEIRERLREQLEAWLAEHDAPLPRRK